MSKLRWKQLIHLNLKFWKVYNFQRLIIKNTLVLFTLKRGIKLPPMLAVVKVDHGTAPGVQMHADFYLQEIDMDFVWSHPIVRLGWLLHF